MNASHCVLVYQRQHSYHSITRLRTTLPSIVFKCSLVKQADCQPSLQQLVWHPARLDRVVSILCLRIRTVELFIYSSGRDHFRSLFSCPSQAGNQICGLHKILCRFCQMLKTFWKNKKYKCFFFKERKNWPASKRPRFLADLQHGSLFFTNNNQKISPHWKFWSPHGSTPAVEYGIWCRGDPWWSRWGHY